MNPDIVEIHNSCKVKVINKQSQSTSELDKLRVTGTCNPIYSIEELILWKANNQQCLWQDFVIPRAATTNHKVAGFGFNCHDNKDELQLTRLVGNSTPKTILCHDYKGGYLEDRFPYGVETDDIYSFFHWSAIDIFIYFSHNIVTIPTLPWLNAAHRHGCKVLGTFITESDSGKEAWDEILKSEENFTAVIENLAEICRFFKFDGYLLNIENAIPTQHVPRLIEFVKLLTEKLHSISPDYEVIWYDSVIAPSGNLLWQNKLCSLNSVFFDLCDGIFLNYCWSEQDLIDSVSLADVRRHDVYVGVDVFGRGCIGGGGFNSSQAMKLIHKHGLSTAIFAPGWTFEKCSNVELFLRREMLFWNNIWPHLFIHGPVTLPFKTSFCIGRGKNKWHMGSIVGDKWGCLTNQQYQLSTCYCPGRENGETNSTSCLDIATSESFQGGTCIEIVNHNNKLEINKSMIRLFTCGFSYSGQIIIHLTHKSTSPIALVLFVQDEKRIRKVFLASVDCLDELSDTNSRVRKIERNSHIDIMKRFSKQAHQNGWLTDIFVYDLIGRTIIEIDFVNLGVEKSTVLLGELSLQKIIKVPSH